MSVRLNPCFGCPIYRGQKRDACTTRNEYRAKIAGLGLRSATFNCPTLAERLKPGTRVQIMHPIFHDGDWDGGSVSQEKVPATIHRQHLNEFACVVDRQPLLELMLEEDAAKVDKVRFRKFMRHSRIVKFLDEPPREICSGGNPVDPNTLSCDRKPGDCPFGCQCESHERDAA